MINIYKNSYIYNDEDSFYLIHDDAIIVFHGERLIKVIQNELKKDLMTDNLKELVRLVNSHESFDFLNGKVTVNRTDDLLDEYQLEAYAKLPSSTNICAIGGGNTGGANLADDNNCITYSIDP